MSARRGASVSCCGPSLIEDLAVRRYGCSRIVAEQPILADGRPMKQAKRGDFTASCGRCLQPRNFRQPPPPKPKARAKEPKPPRVTLPELASEEVAVDERPDELLLSKKPRR